MKTLNLAYPEKSDIKYQIQKFPDGQQNIVIQEVSIRKAAGTLPCKYECDCVNPANYPYQIKSRLNNFLDLELIICAVAALRELGVEEIHLYVPYIIGARSDRKFEEGGNNYLKDVICPIINSLNFKSVTCIDPHSDVLEACIKGFRKESNFELLEWTLANITKENYKDRPTQLQKISDYLNKCILVSPDAGASKKIYKLAEQIGYKGDVITCSKDRDVNGKLTKVIVPYKPVQHNLKDIIIVDDICDGGATFINIAKEIKKVRSKYRKLNSKIYLMVTHGIFSKRFEELSQYFDGIYCTNSYSEIVLEKPWGKYPRGGNFVQQLNVF